MNNEIIGFIASFFVLICFIFDEEIKIRVFDCIGAGLFVIYGILIHSYANIFMNGALVIIQCYKLRKLCKR